LRAPCGEDSEDFGATVSEEKDEREVAKRVAGAGRPRGRRRASGLGVPISDPREIIRSITEGKIDPRLLTTEQRRQCVEILIFQQKARVFTVANFLRVHRRTIEQDLRVIHTRAGRKLQRMAAGNLLAHEAGLYLRRNSELYLAAVSGDVPDLTNARLLASDRPRVLAELGLLPRAAAAQASGGGPVNIAIVIECDPQLESRFAIRAPALTSSNAAST